MNNMGFKTAVLLDANTALLLTVYA